MVLELIKKIFNLKSAYDISSELRATVTDLEMKSVALEHSLNGFDIVDEDGRFLYVNQAYLTMWGYASAEEVYQTLPADHCEDREIPAKIIQELKKNGECRLEFRAKRKDGSLFDVLMWARLAHDIHGKEIYPTTSLDITQAKAFQDNERRLMQTIPQGIWSTTPDGVADFCSERFCEMLGYTSDELLGWGWAEHIIPEDRARLLKAWEVTRKSKSSISMDFRFLRKDGTIRWYLTSGNPFFNANNELVKYYGTWTDIHDQKIIQNNLKDAVQMRDDFLSVASHELKTPLTSLKLQCEILKRVYTKESLHTPEAATFNQYASKMNKQVDRLTRLVNDMLDVSSLHTGKISIQKHHFDLKDLLVDLVERLSPHFADEDCPLPILKIDGKEFIGLWDSDRLEQVFENILINSLRYGYKSQVIVSMKNTDENIKVIISDKGPGFSEEKSKKIFDKFERGVDDRNVTGFGLGLYLSKIIVEAHDGKIWADSRPGEGAIFNVELPKEL